MRDPLAKLQMRLLREGILTEEQINELEQRLDSQNRDLLAAVVFADEIGDESVALDQAKQCLVTLEAQNREMQASSLRESIRIAERKGDFSEAMRLMEQLNDLSVKRKRSKIH